MSNRSQIESKFNAVNIERHKLRSLPKYLQELIFYMDYKIRKDLKSFTALTLCGGSHSKFAVEKNFQRAFTSMNLDEKLNYYSKVIKTSLECSQKCQIQSDFDQTKYETDDKTFFSVKLLKGYLSEETISVEIEKYKLSASNSFKIDLRNYLLRKSNKKKTKCYVLEAIKQINYTERLRFCFLTADDEEYYCPFINAAIDRGLHETIYKNMYDINKRKMINELRISKHFKDQVLVDRSNKSKMLNKFQEEQTYLHPYSRQQSFSICQEMVKMKDNQNLNDDLSVIVDEQNQTTSQIYQQNQQRNIFRIFLPNYHIFAISSLIQYRTCYQSNTKEFNIYENTRNQFTFKMNFMVALPIQIACKAIYNIHLYKYWHSQVKQGQIKLKISSENSCLAYQQLKSFSEWYKNRDFLTLLHLFKEKDNYFLVGKSIENTNYIPLNSVTRGNMEYMLWQITPKPSEEGKKRCRIVMEIKIDHCGVLNRSHKRQLTLKYLRGFENMSQYFENQLRQQKLINYMGMDWVNEDDDKSSPHKSYKTIDFQSGEEISDEEESSEIFYSIQNEIENFQHLDNQQKVEQILDDKKENQQNSEHELQINKNQQKDYCSHSEIVEQIQIDEEGIVQLPNHYLKKKSIMNPISAQTKKIKTKFDNFYLRDIWEIEKSGGLVLVNKQKIKVQDNVSKYIMSSLKKNLFSGKGISLPVDIFNEVSNIQRVCECMCLAPDFLQKCVRMEDSLERFKQVLGFGLSFSIINLDIQKPFNPILGQTYQGYIRGCPIYGEQVSHHPPITSVYFVGRGYKITGSLELASNFGLNSGQIYNHGFLHIIFDDGQEILYQPPSASLSGVTVGDRKFNLNGKGYFLDCKNQLYSEIKIMQSSGFFSKKKRQFCDEVSGQIVKVQQSFVKKFLKAPNNKKPTPDKGDITQYFSSLSGRWPISLKIDQEIIYDIQNTVPDQIVDELCPLNSNSNYREDIYYKKENDIVKSQIHKERLQILQRTDKKLRQKFTSKKSH